MKAQLRFAALFLVATAIFAQSGGASRGTSPAGLGHATRPPGPVAPPRINTGIAEHRSRFRQRSGFRQRYGNGFAAPYYPFLGEYAPDYLPQPEYLPTPENFAPQPAAPPLAQAPEPIQTAHAVIQEYNWKDHNAAAGEQATFTIALKDGSTRSAIVTWVQGRTLHYTDSDDKQGVLSADLIDRDTTRRLNRAKKLSIQLPPG
jgi:hypothetical protein